MDNMNGTRVETCWSMKARANTRQYRNIQHVFLVFISQQAGRDAVPVRNSKVFHFSVLQYTQVSGFPVFGTAQPTEEGFLRLLDKIPKVSLLKKHIRLGEMLITP